MEEIEEENSSSSDDLQLQIAEAPKKKRGRKLRKHQVTTTSDMKLLDLTIQNTINKCKNLTSEAAKKMLCKLVKNDHVLALTLLKAEETKEEEISSEKHDEISESDDDDNDDKKSENDMPVTPKLTRLKAKQLKKQLSIPGNINTVQPDEEVVKLIQEELRSDEEDDEEYQPDDSDGDITNTTFSDIDSQPSTPGSALINESPEKKDGEFKIPKAPLTIEEQENISRRTRSKLCLQTTAIETIESTFIPPDIDLDMYDFDVNDHEDDSEWREFLNEFMMPLTGNTEEDDEADPEYIAEPTVPLDKEELRCVKVSKKELNQLISELLEDSCNTLFDDESLPSSSHKKSTESSVKNVKRQPKNQSKNNLQLQSPKISSKLSSSNDLNTPPHTTQISVANNVENTPDHLSTPASSNYYYSPAQLQSYQNPAYFSPISYQSPNTSTFQPNTQTPLVSPNISATTQVTQLATNDIQNISSPVFVINQPLNESGVTLNSNAIMSSGYYLNGSYVMPQFQSVFIQVPTIVGQEEPSTSEVTNYTDDAKSMMKRMLKFKVFDHLKDEQQIKLENKFDENTKGFTKEQREIFEQQFRMHAQLLCQNYLQTFTHPVHWEFAEILKKNLNELKDASPAVNVNHTQECIKLCSEWEEELKEDNEQNKKYVEFLYTESELDQAAFKEKRRFKGRFHNRLFEKVLQSRAILYVSLLPKMPFRTIKYDRIEPPMSELSLIALNLEHAYDKLYQELNSLNPRRIRKPNISSMISTVIRNTDSFRSKVAMTRIIQRYKTHSQMNPIKFYFLHNKAPAIEQHELIRVDLVDVKRPIDLERGAMSKIWEEYKFSHDRLEKYQIVGENGERCDADESLKELPPDEKNYHKFNVVEEKQNNKNLILSNEVELQVKIQSEQHLQFDIIDIIENKENPSDNLVDKNIVLSENFQKRNPSLKNCQQKSNEEKQRNLTSILKKVTNNIVKSPSKKKSVNFLLPPADANQDLKVSNFADKNKASFLIHQKFQSIIEIFFASFSSIFDSKNDINRLLQVTFIRTRAFDVYWRIVECNIMLSKKNTINKQDGAAVTATNGNHSNGTSSSSSSAENFLKPKRPLSSEEYSKKIIRKLSDNRELIMQNIKNTTDIIEKDCSYAINFLEKVKKTLYENGDEELYSQFMKMLTTFNSDIESVPELYYKMESLLLPNYSDLLDLFLTFLLPEHAAEIGKFTEHFLLTNMSNLVDKLNFFFRKQPSSLKKIYACLNELSNEQDLTIERLKMKILPLLKGNQLLIDWFMELFDRQTDNNNIALDDYETLYLKKNLNDSDMVDDEYEEMQSQEFMESEINNFSSCGIKYINGKIMYRCRTLLPAKISFLANDMTIEERSTMVKDSESWPFCVHEIRKHMQFMDSKKSNEDDEKSRLRKKKSNKRYKVCDSQTLHAHAVRLNSIHAQSGEKLSDVVHLLESNACSSTIENNESPKKQICRNSKKNGNSPKKVIKSPSSSSSSDISSITFSSPSPTKALDTKPFTLNTNKKLRTITNNNSEDEQQQNKKQKLLDSSSENLSIGSDHNDNDSIEMKEDIQMPSTSASSEKSSPMDISSDSSKVTAWTRDEDKTILEEIKNGFSVENKDELINSLMIKLEKRDRNEICERYEFLLNFVTFLTSS